MTIPFEPKILGYEINIHLILEYLAFFIAYRVYVFQRNGVEDTITDTNRLSIILGAAIGAFLGSRIIGFLENPLVDSEFIKLFNTKTIMGGLFGGLLGVETSKKIIGEVHSSGDLFVFPIIIGIIIGRIGCFLMGINEFTYGTTTSFFTGMDLGDGSLRHPIALYEIAFLLILYYLLSILKKQKKLKNGDLFILFMLFYFAFRFIIEFIKPNTFFTFGLSSIQILCLVCIAYYSKFILRYAR